MSPKVTEEVNAREETEEIMPYELCKKVRELEPYEPISGTYRIRLDANESFFDMPPEIREEIKEIIDRTAFNRYPDPTAKKLIEAFAAYYNISPDNVTATNGSDEMLYLLASAMLQKESRVVVVEPDFSMYAFYSFLSENVIFTYQKDEYLNIDVDALISFVKENNADMLIFSNPCNPTGRGIKADDARKLVKGVGSCLVVLDEAYMDFWDQSLIGEAAEYDNLIVLKTASKAVGSAALRLGFAVANKTVTKALRAVKSPYNVNTLSQEIGECIYRHKDMLDKRRDEIIKSRNELYKGLYGLMLNYKLTSSKIYMPCANFVFMKDDNAEAMFRYLLGEGIAVRYFKNAGALRITAGTAEENSALLAALERYIQENVVKINR